MRLLDDVKPDIILLDLDLGGESGINSVQALIAKSGAKVLVLTGSRDASLHDSAVLAGAVGVVEKGEPAETILKAIQKVHEGEIWLDRTATGRIFLELSRSKSAGALNPEQRKIASLTPRERQIVAEIGSDAAASSRIIAERLHISEHTLRNHIASIYEKLEVSSRLELFAYAGRHGIRPA
jgi:DNA-binding NarL/FixJ family response regulator